MAQIYTSFVVFCVVLIYSPVNCNTLFCVDDSECTAENSVCKSHACECQNGQIFNTDYSECLTVALGPNFECVDHKQCQWIIGPSECNNNKCSCKAGYRYKHDRCVISRDLSESCKEDDECYNSIDVNAMKCENDICVCNDGYYMRNFTDCRKLASQDGDCLIDLDCKLQSGKCVNKKCNQTKNILESEIIPSEDTEQLGSVLDIVCTKDSDCASVSNSICIGMYQQCMCEPYHTYNKTYEMCIPALGEQCKSLANDDACGRYAHCNPDTEICECNDYFINGAMNEKCYKPARKINDSCTDDRNCYTFGIHGVCIDKKCGCDSLSVFKEKSMMCVAGNVDNEENNNGCKTNADCNIKGQLYMKCVNHACVCNASSTEVEEICRPNFGFTCDANNPCYGENVDCVNKICRCPLGYIQETSEKCVEKIDNANSSCKVDIQCQFILGEGGICNNSTCVCNNNYRFVNNTCMAIKYLGDTCANLKECKVILKSEMVWCLNGKCICKYGYKKTSDRLGCSGAVSVITPVNLITGIVSVVVLHISRKTFFV